MRNPMFNPPLIQETKPLCKVCTENTHLSPNTRISPPQQDTNRLKTHAPLCDDRLYTRKVQRSNR
jgi:hypothetical protein